MINAFSSVQTNKLRKELNYAALAKAEVSAAVLSGIVGIGLAFYGAVIWSLVAQVMSRGGILQYIYLECIKMGAFFIVFF